MLSWPYCLVRGYVVMLLEAVPRALPEALPRMLLKTVLQSGSEIRA
jgi:hypothetical protein